MNEKMRGQLFSPLVFRPFCQNTNSLIAAQAKMRALDYWVRLKWRHLFRNHWGYGSPCSLRDTNDLHTHACECLPTTLGKEGKKAYGGVGPIAAYRIAPDINDVSFA